MKALGIALIALVGCQQSPSAMTARPRVEGSGSTAPASAMGETEKHSDQIARATMEVDAAEPYRVTKFEIHPIPTPPELLSPELAALQRIDDKRRRAVVDAIAREIDAHYVTPDVGTKMIAAMRDHLARGDYDAITQAPDFAAALTKDLREVSHDKHLGVDFMPRPRDMPPPSRDALREMQRDMAKRVNYGFGAIERMPNNIARIEILGFPPILDDDPRAAVGEQMTKIADADAVIFDLRHVRLGPQRPRRAGDARTVRRHAHDGGPRPGARTPPPGTARRRRSMLRGQTCHR